MYDAATGGSQATQIPNVLWGSNVVVDGAKITINGIDSYATAQDGYEFLRFNGIPTDGKISQDTVIRPVFARLVNKPTAVDAVTFKATVAAAVSHAFWGVTDSGAKDAI